MRASPIRSSPARIRRCCSEMRKTKSTRFSCNSHEFPRDFHEKGPPAIGVAGGLLCDEWSVRRVVRLENGCRNPASLRDLEAVRLRPFPDDAEVALTGAATAAGRGGRRSGRTAGTHAPTG